MKKQAIQILAIVLGALALGYGVYVTFFERNGYIKSTAVIEQIDEIFSGVDGDGAHSHGEYVVISSIPKFAAIAADYARRLGSLSRPGGGR